MNMDLGKYKLVPITEEDYNLIYKIKKNAYIKYVDEIWGWNEEVQKDLFEKFFEKYKQNIYLIKLEDNTIGFYSDENLDNGDYEVGNICIIPEYQGKGIGTQILKAILEINKNKNIHIQYFKQNPVGNLYTRLGFIPNGETDYHYQMIKRKKLKRRFANQVEGEYFQKRIDEKYFNGYACYIKIKGVTKPLIVNNGVSEICIKDEDYVWIEVYPDNSKYAITIMFDNNKNLIEWYFDISKKVGIENGIPFEDDLYLDMIITPNGKKIILDENELLNAYKNGDITSDDVENAYQTLKELESKYVNNLSDLVTLTNNLYGLFNNNNKIL